jgi:hypothetical protein
MDAKVKEWISKVAEKIYLANVVPLIRKREWEDLNSDIERVFRELSLEKYGQDKYTDFLKSEFLQQEKAEYTLELGNGFLHIRRDRPGPGSETPLAGLDTRYMKQLDNCQDTYYCGYLVHRMRDTKADPWVKHSGLRTMDRETIDVRMKYIDFLFNEEEFGTIIKDLDTRVSISIATKYYTERIDEEISDLDLETQTDLENEVVFFGTLGNYKRKLGVHVSEWAEKIREIEVARDTAHFNACLLLKRYSENGILREDLIENWPDVGQCLEIAEKLAEKWGTKYVITTGPVSCPDRYGEIRVNGFQGSSYISRSQYLFKGEDKEDKLIQDTRFLILYEKFIKHGVPLLKK